MTSHDQEERGQTLLGSAVLIPAEPLIPMGQESRANPRAAGRSWESTTVLCVGDNVPPRLRLPSHMFSPAPGSFFPSRSSILQPAHLFQLPTLMLDREEGPILAASRESHTTMPSPCPYLI